MTFYRLSKLAGRYKRDPTQEELKKPINDSLSFESDNCVGNALNFLLKFKGEEPKVNNKIVEYILQLHAHNGSDFDTWIILNNLPCVKHIVDFIKIGKGTISLKIFNSYIQKVEIQIPQYLNFRCGKTHLIYSLKKLCETFKLPKRSIENRKES